MKYKRQIESGCIKLKFKYEKVRSEKLYAVGYDETNHRYLMEIVVPSGAWYSQYYIISKEEYNWYDLKIESLDLLAKDCFENGIYSSRFVFSDKSTENDLAKKLKIK